MVIQTPAQFKGKDAFYEKMLRMFIKDHIPDKWPDFDTIAADTENTKNFVHKIKGVAGNLGIAEILRCAADFENSLRERNPDKAMYEELINACEELKAALPPV